MTLLGNKILITALKLLGVLLNLESSQDSGSTKFNGKVFVIEKRHFCACSVFNYALLFSELYCHHRTNDFFFYRLELMNYT